MSNNFKTYVKEGYKNSDTLYKCVSYLVRNASAIPPVLFTDDTMTDRYKTHPILDKLKRPNPEQSGVAYREAVLGYKYLAGNSFQYAIRGKNGMPDELWPLRPDRMEIMAVPQKGIVGYKHQNIEGMIQPQNIAHLKYWNPDDDDQKGMGMSPVQAAALNIDMQIAGKKWNLGLMQNGARPPGIWKIPALMGFNERKQLEQKLHDTYSGATRAGKSPLLDGGLDWKPTGLQPAQMEWLDSLKYNGGSIANILNMPPQLIGDTSSTTYDNMEQAKAASYTEEIFPTLDDFYALLNWWLVPMYPDLVSSGAFLYYDKESVEVVQKLIQATKDAQATRAIAMWNDGMGTMNECRDFCGLPSLGPDGDVFKFGAVLVKKSELGKYAEQSLAEPAAPPPAKPEPLLDAPIPVQQPQNTQEPKPDDNPTNDNGNPPDNTDQQPQKRISWRDTKALDLSSDEEKHAYAKSVEASRAKWETKAEKLLQAYFKNEQKAVVEAINKAALPSSAEDRAEAAIKKQSKELKDILIKLYQDMADDVGNDILKQLKANAGMHETKASAIDTINSGIQTYLSRIAGTKVKSISSTTGDQVKGQLSEGVAKDETVPQLAKRVDSLYTDQIIPNRSAVVSATESHSAAGWASWQAGKQSGMTLSKVWLALNDSKTRPAHSDADEQEVGMDEKFVVDGEELDYPGDGSAANAANCRCSMYFKRVTATVEDSSDSEGDSSDEDKSNYISRYEYRKFMELVSR
jgi:HK97 family phage portal protein